MRIPGRRKTPAPRTEPVQPSVGDLAAAAAIIDTYDSARTDRDSRRVRKPMTRVERYFAYLDWVTENPDPSIFRAPSTKLGLPNVAAMQYPGFPEPGMTSVFTYGLSVADHPSWGQVTPELCLVVTAENASPWVQVTGLLADEFRGAAPFGWGETFTWTGAIDPASSMRCFLTAPPYWDLGDEALLRADVGEDRPVVIVGLYPIHESEMRFVEAHGWREFFGLEWDPADVTRPPAV